MASTIILSDNGASSGSAGYKITAGNDGVLILQTTTSGGTATNAIYVDTSQNVGVGVTPSAWQSGVRALQIGFAGSVINPNSTGQTWYTTNAYYNAGWKYINSDSAAWYQQSTGHVWYIAPSGTAGNAITFTQAMTLDASGNLGIGTTSPSSGSGGGLTLGTAASGKSLHVYSSSYASNGLANFYGTDGSMKLQMGALSSTSAYIFANTGCSLVFYSGGSTSATLDSSGNLGVGTSSPATKLNVANGAIRLTDGYELGWGDNSTYLVGNSSSDVMQFITNSSERARIDSNGVLMLGTNSVGSSPTAYLQVGGNSTTSRILPRTDNTGYVGDSGQRWQALYAVNGTIQTSDGREKNTIQDSNLGLSFINSLRPVSYKWNVGENVVTYDEEGNEVVTPRAGARTHYGFIAQEVQAAIPDGVDFGGFVQEPDDGPMSLRYHEFIGPLVKAIQEQQAIIEQLKARLDAANL